MNPCKKCGCLERTSCGSCKSCNKIYQAKCRKEHPEMFKASREKYKLAHPERVLKSKRKGASHKRDLDRAYYLANAEKIKARSKKRHAAQGDQINAAIRQRRAEDPEPFRAKEREYNKHHRERRSAESRAWAKNNPEQRRVQHQNRKARMRKSGGKLSYGILKKIFALQRGLCAICRTKLDKYHVDHVTSLAAGGLHEDANIQLLCPSCNMSKGAKDPIVFMRSRGFLL